MTTFADMLRTANARILVEGDLDAIPAHFAPDYVAHATEQDMTGGPGAVRRYVATVRRAFSKLQADVEILVERNDRIAWQRTVRGVHTGEFMGFPATSRATVWRDMVVTRFHDGLIAEDWVMTDIVERLLLARKRRG